MNLWLSCHFLLAGLFLSSSAPTPEECQPLVTPLSLSDPSMWQGRWNFITGYSGSKIFKAILKITESSWMNVTLSSSADVAAVAQMDKVNGTCRAAAVNTTFDGDTASTSIANITSDFHMLPTCDGCMVMNINTTGRDLDKIAHVLNIDGSFTGKEVTFRSLYLMSRESTLKDSDLEHFRQQASCLGISGEPDFLYDPKNGFCTEAVKLNFE